MSVGMSKEEVCTCADEGNAETTEGLGTGGSGEAEDDTGKLATGGTTAEVATDEDSSESMLEIGVLEMGMTGTS